MSACRSNAHWPIGFGRPVRLSAASRGHWSAPRDPTSFVPTSPSSKHILRAFYRRPISCRPSDIAYSKSPLVVRLFYLPAGAPLKHNSQRSSLVMSKSATPKPTDFSFVIQVFQTTVPYPALLACGSRCKAHEGLGIL